MASNEFAGSLYRNQEAMVDAIAYAWLGSGGICGDAERKILTEMTDEQLAAECIQGWELDQRSGEKEWEDPADEDSAEVECADSHMEEQGYDREDLVIAFAKLREKLLAVTVEQYAPDGHEPPASDLFRADCATVEEARAVIRQRIGV